MKQLFAFILLVGLFAVTSGNGAIAQSEKPMRIILPVGPGSGVDANTRLMSSALAGALGRPVVIENQPGAGGVTGTHQLVKSPPDGNTIAVVSNNHVVFPSVYKDLPFDPVTDVTPIMRMGFTPFMVVAHPSANVRNLQELLALARAKPGALNYGSSGNGTILHLAAELLMFEAQIDVKHIPYKSAGQMLTDLVGGQVQLGVFAISGTLPHVKSGALRSIGLTSPARIAQLPDFPTIAEQGLPNYSAEGWFAAIGPAKMPPALVGRVHAALVQALNAPDVRAGLTKQGTIIVAGSPEEAATFLRAEMSKYANLVKRANVKLD